MAGPIVTPSTYKGHAGKRSAVTAAVPAVASVPPMPTDLVRRSHDALQALHSFTYFAPETEAHLVAVGLQPGRMCYFAGRAAPLGAVGAGVVTATFYNFSPALVSRHIPRAWALASPEVVVAARFAAVDAGMRRLLGEETIASEQVATAARLARRASEGCTPEGRPMYAALADLEWPEEPHLMLWHALSLLREYRGDGHIAALVAAGLSGIEALVTHTATGRGFVASFAKASRRWSDEQWDAATDALGSRGILAADGTLTDEGHRQRAHIEAETDRTGAPPWDLLGEGDTEILERIGVDLTARIRAAGAFPAQAFASP